jgi:hypothetical protein
MRWRAREARRLKALPQTMAQPRPAGTWLDDNLSLFR